METNVYCDDRIEDIVNILCNPTKDEKLIELCLLLCTEFQNIKICKVDELGSGSNGAQYDPINEDIYDPISEDIFDPQERFYPEGGIPLRAISEGIYDSYGNRIHPNDSKAVLLSLLSWIIRWENFEGSGYQSDCEPSE